MGREDHDQPDGRSRILEAAMETLESDGEAALRVLDVALRADVAAGLINHHFGGRDGLVIAAQQERFDGATREDTELLDRLVGAEPSRQDFLECIEAIITDVVSHERAAHRLSRLAIIGSAHGRPDLHDGLGDITAGLIDRVTTVVEHAQQAGYVRVDLDARAIATFLQAYPLGLVLSDLDPDAPDEGDIAQVVTAVLGALFTET